MNKNINSFWSIVIPVWVMVVFLGITFTTIENVIGRISIVFALFFLNAVLHNKGNDTVCSDTEKTADEKIIIMKKGSWGCDMTTGSIFLVSAIVTHLL